MRNIALLLSYGLRLTLMVILGSSPVLAVFIDGTGHYSVLGDLRSSPLHSGSSDRYQAYRQSLRFMGEARLNDNISLFTEFQLFADDSQLGFWGDRPKPSRCLQQGKISDDCQDEHQNPTFPAYEHLIPEITQAYVRYSFPYCLLEAGRRGRNWGIGMFLDAGESPFSSQRSVFDGITCHINADRNQLLSFSIGYDKLAETGAPLYSPSHFVGANNDDDASNTATTADFGAYNHDDDLHQIFLAIEYDSRDLSSSDLKRFTGIYFSTILSPSGNIDVKFFDLYVELEYRNFATRNECLFRLGKSSDPSWYLLGGKPNTDSALTANELNSTAFAGNMSYMFYRTGSAVDKSQSRTRALQKHSLFVEYLFAPGDADGYYSDYDPETDTAIAASKRNTSVSAYSFHRNFKPALLFFNSPYDADHSIAGVFSPDSLMNVYLVALGYRYDNLIWGNAELKFITGWQHKTIPSDVKAHYEDRDDKPVGYYGRELGYEVDLRYSYEFSDALRLSLGGAIAIPGNFWRTADAMDRELNFLLQSNIAFTL
ncbi:MAG: hypothetical protein OYH77_08935 [Pseudomonadota bacterium]|nr:hypothetical protein [Pseudomonadota bacterium]